MPRPPLLIPSLGPRLRPSGRPLCRATASPAFFVVLIAGVHLIHVQTNPARDAGFVKDVFDLGGDPDAAVDLAAGDGLPRLARRRAARSRAASVAKAATSNRRESNDD